MSDNGFEVLLTVLTFSIATALVGAAVQFVLGRSGIVTRGIGITLGLGLAATGIFGTLSFFVLGDVMLLLWALAGAALLIDAFVVVQAARGSTPDRDFLRRLRPTLLDLLAAVAAVAVLMPVIAQGEQFWTNGVNDFPSYAASVEIWLGESGHAEPWLARHPDQFGSSLEFRGMNEKPVVTAIMVAASEVTGTPPWELLGALSLLFVFVILAILMVIARAQWGLSSVATAAAVLVPSLSIIPMSRVFDAQLGQTAAVALVATLIAIAIEFTKPTAATSRRHLAVGAGACGLIAAATTGTNVTLVVGTIATWGALLAALVWRTTGQWREPARRLALGAIVAIVATLPMVNAYRSSMRTQTNGEAGFNVPLASPLSMFGLQLRLDSGAGLRQTAVAWLAVIAVVACLTIVLVRRRQRNAIVMVIVVACAAVNAAVIMALTGVENYASHKTMAVAFALVLPLVVVHIASRIPKDWLRLRDVAIVGLAIASGLIAHNGATRVFLVASSGFGKAIEDPRVAEVDTINIDLGDQYENSIAALAVDSDRVVVTGRTYAPASTPIGSTFLLEAAQADEWGAVSTPLGDGYVLAQVDLSVRAGEALLFDAAHPTNDRYLHRKAWYPLEPSGVWSGFLGKTSAAVVVDLPPELVGRDVRMTVTGARFVLPDMTRELRLSVNGDEVASESFSSFTASEITATITPDALAPGSTRLVISLSTPDLVSPGAPDERTLGFLLQSITFEPA